MRTPPRSIYVGGRWREVSSGRTLPVVDPSTEEVFAQIGAASREDVDRACKSAHQAFSTTSWRIQDEANVKRRAALLRKLAQRLAKEKKRLALLESRDCGKPVEESEWDIDDAVACFEHYADLASKYAFEESVDLPEDFGGLVRKEALGVVALITPWNYPLLMAIWKIAPALAAGCCVVLKPSEHASLTCLELAAQVHEAGFPAGVFNVVTGIGAEAGAALTEHPLVCKAAFTGSSATGRVVATAMATQAKPCTLELGGKSALIVFDDCDMERAVEWAMFGCFWTNGQICSATSRLLIHERIKKPFLKLLKRRAESINVGDPMEVGTRLGPLVNQTQYRKVLRMIDRAIREGAQVLTGGGRPKAFQRGFYLEPTIFVDVAEESEVWQEEVFGPVLSVRTFATEAEAVEAANGSAYALAAAVISRDEKRCKRVAKAVKAGVVWIGCSQPCFVQMPWGGAIGKASGYGRDLGVCGFENYLHVKSQVTYKSDAIWDWYPRQKSKL